MSDSVGLKRAWLERVLGFQFPPSVENDGAEATDSLDLKARLQVAGGSLRSLRDASAPEAGSLLARYGALVAAAKADPASVAAPLIVLESDIARALSAARGRQAAPQKGRGVAYRKLLLRWREAQATLDINLKSLGATLLARRDIQADPRIGEIKQAIADLPKLVPEFGGELEGVLDAALSTADSDELARLASAGIAAIDAYRKKLQTAAHLLELERFAAGDLGASLPLHTMLDQALVELKQALAA